MHTATISWGPAGVQEALARSDLIIVVDVLRFSSTITTAVANGAACIGTVSAGNTGFIGCFLNAGAAGRLIHSQCAKEQRNVTVVAVGEALEDQYADLQQRRFAIEDYLACGHMNPQSMIISSSSGTP